jgi:hypothetical protein
MFDPLFIFWLFHPHHASPSQDGDNINNTLEVIPAKLSTELIQKQVRQEGGAAA